MIETYVEMARALRTTEGLSLNAASERAHEEAKERGYLIKKETIRQGAMRRDKEVAAQSPSFEEALDDLYRPVASWVETKLPDAKEPKEPRGPSWERTAFIDVRTRDGDTITLLLMKRVRRVEQPRNAPEIMEYKWGVRDEAKPDASIDFVNESREECLRRLRSRLAGDGWTEVVPGTLEKLISKPKGAW